MTHTMRHVLFGVGLFLTAAGCSVSDPIYFDSGIHGFDFGLPDDFGVRDAGVRDTGNDDIGLGRPDTGVRDVGVSTDVGFVDAGDYRPCEGAQPPDGPWQCIPARRTTFETHSQGRGPTRWPGQQAVGSEAPTHRVIITRDFFMFDHEVTVSEFAEIIQDLGLQIPLPPNLGCPDCPMTGLTYAMIVSVLNEISKNEGLDPCYEEDRSNGEQRIVFVGPQCNGYRLPTDAEWEFAARDGVRAYQDTWAGDLNPQSVSMSCEFDQTLSPNNGEPVAWYCANTADGSTGQTPTLQPTRRSQRSNNYRLYDMLGNAWEMTSSGFSAYSLQTQTDPLGDDDQPKVVRGGAFDSPAFDCRSVRRTINADAASDNVGFRIVRSAL